MKKIGILFITTLLLISCKQKEEPLAVVTKPTEKQSTTEKAPKKVLGDYMSCNENVLWGAKASEDSDFFVRLMFKEDVVHYQIHGQCAYTFLTNYQYTGADKIELLWSYKTDCIRDPGFLLKPNGVKHYPKTGDVFSEYDLVNDSVIKVKYNFPEWATAVNKIAKDSIFPNYLYLEQEN
ncbi:MAG: hypothetical protein ACLGH8_15655 [Bacteroidia bacterium]